MERLIAVLLLATGCAVSEPEPEPSTGPCDTDSDCATDARCEQGICARLLASGCTDGDDDGYGVGLARSDCRQCLESGRCDEDCDDSDPLIHPGGSDLCDNVDNNCNGTVDEPQTCEASSSCAPDPVLLVGCVNSVCEYLPPDQSPPGCDAPVICVDGTRTASPACL